MSQLRYKLLEAADQFGIPICFRDEIEYSNNSVLLKWSDGTQTRITVEAEPILIDDNTTIKLNYKLKATKGKIL